MPFICFHYIHTESNLNIPKNLDFKIPLVTKLMDLKMVKLSTATLDQTKHGNCFSPLNRSTIIIKVFWLMNEMGKDFH